MKKKIILTINYRRIMVSYDYPNYLRWNDKS